MRLDRHCTRDGLPAPLIAVLTLGMGGQLGQILLLRELLIVFHGHELTLGIILACWMAWVGVGSWLGTLLAERVRRPRRVLVGLAAAIWLAMPATLLLIRALRGLFQALPGTHLSLSDTLLTCLLVAAPLGLLFGAQFVLLARLWRESRAAADMSGAARTYLFEAVGNLLGGLLFTWWLVHVLAPLQMAALVGTGMLAGVFSLARPAPRRRAGLAFLMIAGVALMPVLGRLDAWAYRLQWRHLAPDSELVEIRPSRYGTISVARREGQYSFLQSNHLTFTTAGPDAKGFELEEFEGARLAHLALAQHRQPRQVLLIGGGMRGVLREMLHYPEVEVDYVELDRALIDIAGPYLPPATRAALRDPRVGVIAADGRRHLKRTDRRYDLVVVDLPDPATAVLNRYYTREFFREVRARLAPSGVLVIGVTSSAGLRSSAIANRNATIYHTLREGFPQVLAVGDSFCLFFATEDAGQISAAADTLAARYRQRGIASPGFSERHFYPLFQQAPLRRLNWMLRHHGRRSDAVHTAPDPGPLFPPPLAVQQAAESQLPPVERRYFSNADFRPIGYYHTLVLWNLLAGTEAVGFFRWLLRVKWWWAAPLAGAPLIGVLLWRCLPGRCGRDAGLRYGIGWAVFIVGFSSMVLQVLLLFAFQSIYGYVYEYIGLIVALFMGGLGAGAALAERLPRCTSDPLLLVWLQLAFVVQAGAMAVGIPAMAGLPAAGLVFGLFAGMAVLTGMLNGANYPLATACQLRLGRGAERSAGLVYAVELAGACLGAILASVVLAPILGLVASCVVVGILHMTTGIALCGGEYGRRRSSPTIAR